MWVQNQDLPVRQGFQDLQGRKGFLDLWVPTGQMGGVPGPAGPTGPTGSWLGPDGSFQV